MEELMFICIECYNARGEKALLHDGKIAVCQFCEQERMTYGLHIYELNHWRDVLKLENERGLLHKV